MLIKTTIDLIFAKAINLVHVSKTMNRGRSFLVLSEVGTQKAINGNLVWFEHIMCLIRTSLLGLSKTFLHI